MSRILHIKPDKFFAKEYKDGIIVAFKNIGDNSMSYADQIHQIVSKNFGVDLFVSDIIESIIGTDSHKDRIKDSLFIYMKNGVSISACGIYISHNKDHIEVKYYSDKVLIVKRKLLNKFWYVLIGLLLCFLGYNTGLDDVTNNQYSTIDESKNISQTESPIDVDKKDNNVSVNDVSIDNNEEATPIITNDTTMAIVGDKEHIENKNNVSAYEPIVTPNIPEDFVLVPSGTLYRYEDGYDNEHQKYIYKDIPLDAFYICIHEVTQEEYERMMGSNPSQIKGSKIPVNTVQFIDAIRYCNARSLAEGYDGFYTISNNIVHVNPSSNGYRLPNEYEWAFAARKDGKTKTKYASGNNIKDIAWYGGNSNCTLHQVCTKSPNQRGIYDMNGNVSEWLWEKDFNGHNCQVGSDFMTFISFGESDVVGPNYCSEENGFRVVLITKGQGNSNIKNQLTIKHHIKERHSSVEYKRKQDQEDAERDRKRKALKAEANEYVQIADKAYSDYIDSFDENKVTVALTNYRKALDLNKKHGLFFVSEREAIEQKINILEKELK